MLNSERIGILGANGFVGSNICKELPKIRKYTRANMNTLLHQDLDLLIISAVSAEKWRANSEPERDLIQIQFLLNFLSQLKVKSVLLISTIDVYGPNFEFDEDTERSKYPFYDSYGSNRHYFELKICEKFADTKILRLPGLFGPGLKKNLIYDLLNNLPLNFKSTKDSYQYLYTPEIPNLMREMIEMDLKLFHAATEPVSVSEILNISSEILGNGAGFINNLEQDVNIQYNMKTKYRKSKYLFNHSEVLEEMRKWFLYEKYKLLDK
jgi:nucleoside-diphosphate-sugar epimerase